MGSNYLEKILKHKKIEVEESKGRQPLADIKVLVKDAPPTSFGSFSGALKIPGQVAIIAEIKRRSPSRGLIRENFSLPEAVGYYREAGAQALSILTDSHFFGGAPEYLSSARQLTKQPLLRKDFIIDPYQIYQSRLLGADAVLLIASALKGEELPQFIELAHSLGLECLVETRSPEEIDRAMEAGATLIGINNRDLNTFQVDIAVTVELIKNINKPGITVVSESGIKTREDVLKMGACGVDAVLVGEALMGCSDPAEALRRLKGEDQMTPGEATGL